MTEHEAQRTLVKSPPELWAECSDATSLARHLGQFGEIRITRLEPDNAVAWEGTFANGTVRLEPSGWGTRVILTARDAAAEQGPVEPEAAAEDAGEESVAVPEAAVEPEASEPGPDAAASAPAPEPEPVATHTPPAPAARRGGLVARLLALFRPAPPPPAPVARSTPPAPLVSAPPSEPEPALRPEPEPAPPPEPVQPEPESVAPGPIDAAAVLTAALDSLGQAHHRPFSRA